MSYKDEYEVARLYSEPAFQRKLDQQFEGDYSIRFHLAPPLIAKRDPVTGQLRKREYGGWMMSVFRILASMKGLRGGSFDIFGYTDERRMERQLIVDYRHTLEQLSAKLDDASLDIAVQIADVPMSIKGFGHVKLEAVNKAKRREAELLASMSERIESPDKLAAAG
jgi:indolepyruvate ferredoxin oxidoreductase